ncbi:MAG: universal stress protein [Desulfocapsaceae bacterium]|nr:universal stress protein [Desulfocapsaceae bacterium]
MEIKKIVVPVDFQKNTQRLVEYAVYIARQLSAEISFCHVLEPFVMGDMMLGSPSFSDFDVKRSSDAEERMANLIQDIDLVSPHSSGKVLLGDTVDEIVGYAKQESADMIIIGTHGAKGLEKILLGSVAERVVKRAGCPCLVMNPYK